MKHRAATQEELIASLQTSALSHKGRVTIRHFIREESYAKGRHGVRHVERTSVRWAVENGGCFVTLYGQREAITASVATLDNGREFVYDIRLDSPHLPRARLPR